MIFLRHKTHNRQARNNTHTTSGRRISLNERLASIGGLFGALSIIITGALLYAIFTARTEDKWYYISAVLVNVSLLIVLMTSAIIFDRYYLNKWATTSSASHSMPSASVLGNSTYHGTSVASNVEMSSFTNYYPNDGPPQYPGYFPQPQLAAQIPIPNTTVTSSVLLYTALPDNNIIAARAENINTANACLVNEMSTDEEKNKSYRPPSYYELYPHVKSTETAQTPDEQPRAEQIDNAKTRPNEPSTQVSEVNSSHVTHEINAENH